MTTPSLGKTKKLKKSKNNQELWTLFNSEIPDQTKEPLECVYRSSGQRENCDLCSSSLAITEEGFLDCTNKLCGSIYTDMLDQGAEWRYYGVDDNQSSDPA